MVDINLGNVTGGTGITSNLDTEALIADASSARQIPIDNLNDRVDANVEKTAKYSEFRTLLNDLGSAVDFLRNPPSSILNPYANVFDYTVASLSSSTLTTSNFLSVTSDPGALDGSTQIEIGAIAKGLEQASGSFNTRNADVTTAASGSYFSAGTFQIGSGTTITTVGGTADSFQLSDSDYSTFGSVSGIVASIDNFTVTGLSGGQTGLQGEITGFVGSYNGDTDELTLSFIKNGVTYTSNVLDATTSLNLGANSGLASGTVITFTADSGGDNETSLDITLAADVIIDADEDNVTTFLGGLVSGLSDVDIYQSREISNFVDANVKSPLSNLTSSDIRFNSDNFNVTSGNFGSIGNINVKYSTGTDGAISIDINGETFRATGLGTTINSNLTLQSTSSDKSLTIAFGDAGESIDITDSAESVELEKSLGYAFGTRELVDFTIDSGDSLNDIAFAFNQITSETGLSASIIQINEFDFRLSIKSTNEGLDNTYEFFDDSNVLTNASIVTTKDATNAILRIDGVEIERSSNTINDAIEDVTLNLLQKTPDYDGGSPESIDVNIGNDIDTIVQGVVSFLDAYNAVRVFSTEQNARDENFGFTEDAILGGDSILSNLTDQLINEVSGIVSGVNDDNFDSLTDSGIEITDFQGTADTVSTANILTYDENTLRTALLANFDKVRRIFEMNAVTGDSDLTLTKSSNTFTLNEFQLKIDTSAEEGSQVQLLNYDGTDYLDGSGNEVYLEFSGSTITGPEDSVVEGLEFLYVGDGTSTISVDISQGLADRLYNTIDAYAGEDGIIDSTVDLLTEQNNDYRSDIVSQQERLDTFVETLRAQFVALEAAIASVNSILGFLQSNEDARNAR